jgi:hypothetical protein
MARRLIETISLIIHCTAGIPTTNPSPETEYSNKLNCLAVQGQPIHAHCLMHFNEVMMFTACLPQHSQNPTRLTNRSSGLIRNSYLLNTFFWLSRSKGMTVDIWIRDYNPPMCFQKKISGRSKHNA